MPSESAARDLIGQLYNHFLDKGYFNSTGGGITILADNGKLYYVSTDLIIRSNNMGKVTRFIPHELVSKESLSECESTDICAPLILFPFKNLGARALIHSHSANSIICSLMDECIIPAKFEMSKNIYSLRENRFLREFEAIKIPIVNRNEINDVIGESCVFLVRGHGLFLWSRSRQHAVMQFETFETMFEIMVKTAGENTHRLD